MSTPKPKPRPQLVYVDLPKSREFLKQEAAKVIEWLVDEDAFPTS